MCRTCQGGGQPTDTGIITTQDGKVWSVLQAKRHGGHAVHYVQVVDSDLESALQTFAPGTRVTASLDEAGYDRRYDHVGIFSFPRRARFSDALLADVYAYFSTFAICFVGDAPRSTNTFLVSNVVSSTMLCRNSPRHDTRRNSFDSDRS